MDKTKFHHVGIVIPDFEQVQELLDQLGLEIEERFNRYVPEFEAECYFTRGDGASIEFIVPRGGKLTEFNKGRGGIHHIALEVPDLDALTDGLADQGVRLLREQAVEAGRLRINFLPPACTRGLIVEFVEIRPGFDASAGDPPAES